MRGITVSLPFDIESRPVVLSPRRRRRHRVASSGRRVDTPSTMAP